MDPERYYKYSDFGTIDAAGSIQTPKATDNPKEDHVKPQDADSLEPEMVYMLDKLMDTRPGAVLAVGFGNQLKGVVRAASNAGINPLFSTGTNDKLRAFSFGDQAKVISLGAKFDERLFANEFAILDAADRCNAKTILWAKREAPSELLVNEAHRADILLLTPFRLDKSLMAWETTTPTGEINDEAIVWSACPHCKLKHSRRAVKDAGWKCPDCGKLYRMTSDERIELLLDDGSFSPIGDDVEETNPLDFPGFDEVIDRARKNSGHDEGARCGTGRIGGIPVAIAIMESDFIMGSMGTVVGERITRTTEYATEHKLPLIILCASGGARMQEGLASLMQMAKVSAAIDAHNRAGLLYISVITDPTTGGVTASFATLGDIIIAEPGALFGFAGRRVIQNTIRQTLPEDFQSAEFALEHGLIDMIVERSDMRKVLFELLELHGYDPVIKVEIEGAYNPEQNDDLQKENPHERPKSAPVPAALTDTLTGLLGGVIELAEGITQTIGEQTSKASLWWSLRNRSVRDTPGVKICTEQAGDPENTAWESVKLARNPNRPTSRHYIESMIDGFIELHGDRAFSDDKAIIAGIGRIDGKPVTIIAEEKGINLKDRVARNFGCPQPEGYRKAMRLMREAEKFNRPIICLVDTQGAFCGKEAEERGMGGAIAESLSLMSRLEVPIVSVILGEGGSGGALALAAANKVAMLENAVYSVLSPEGFASILWKDGTRAPEAAQVMKMSAKDALELGIIEDVIPEGNAAAHENPDQAAAAVWLYLTNALEELDNLNSEELRKQRYARFRKF